MKELKITLKGTAPLLMHSCKGVNPLHPITRQLKERTGKRKKTEEDLAEISRLEWEQALYYDSAFGLYMPAECLNAVLIEGGKHNKKGADLRKYCTVPNAMNYFDIGEKFKSLDDLYTKSDGRYIDCRPVSVMRAKVNRTRPRFNTWQTVFVLAYDENYIDLDTIQQALEYAGRFVGLCDGRTLGYGRFETLITELN